MRRALVTILCCVALLAACGAGADAHAPPATLDLDRYLGRWYVIARTTPGDGVGTWIEYRALDDGRIEAREHWRDRSFGGEVHVSEQLAQPDPAAPSRWRVSTGWLSSEELQVSYVSADYRHALVTGTGNSRAWILARTPQIPEWSYAGLLARLALLGVDVTPLKRVPQAPAQVGMPGYE